MSYQTTPAIVVQPKAERIRYDNAQSSGGLGKGTMDLLITGGVIAIGAIGGYYAIDYIVKSKIIDSVLGSISTTPDTTPAEDDDGNGDEDEDEDKEANIAYTMPVFDRGTRVNSWGNTGVSAYRGRIAPPRLAPHELVEIEDVEGDETGLNQIVTDNEVYDV